MKEVEVSVPVNWVVVTKEVAERVEVVVKVTVVTTMKVEVLETGVLAVVLDDWGQGVREAGDLPEGEWSEGSWRVVDVALIVVVSAVVVVKVVVGVSIRVQTLPRIVLG